MPARLPRACRMPGCPHPAVSRGRCRQHAAPDYAERNRFGASVYNTQRWRRLSREWLAVHPFCVCGCGRLADVVDHIRPHRGDEALAFDRCNLQSLARDCHGRKTRDETRGAGRNVGHRPTAAGTAGQRRTPMQRMKSISGGRR